MPAVTAPRRGEGVTAGVCVRGSLPAPRLCLRLLLLVLVLLLVLLLLVLVLLMVVVAWLLLLLLLSVRTVGLPYRDARQAARQRP